MEFSIKILATVAGFILFFAILRDSFETIVLPRRVSRRFRLSRWFYLSTWTLWSTIARKIRPGNRREFYLSYYGPLSLLLLLVAWALVLILAYSLFQWGLSDPLQAPEKQQTFWTYLYMSGTTFVTLGYGDVVPLSLLGRSLAVGEAATGFLFLALIVGYVPVIYQSFSRRETQISLLDARAGSPPSASEMLRRHYRDRTINELGQFLGTWERWCAEVLESHLSYPVLTYYRSQHERQSWLAALTTILDTCALMIVGFEGVSPLIVRPTFAIARHHVEEDAERRLYEIRRSYEPFVNALADHLLVNLPPWIPATKTVDDWQTSAWDHFAEWSPEKLDEITHIITDHRKKMPLRHQHEHTHTDQSEQQSAEGSTREVS